MNRIAYHRIAAVTLTAVMILSSALAWDTYHAGAVNIVLGQSVGVSGDETATGPSLGESVQQEQGEPDSNTLGASGLSDEMQPIVVTTHAQLKKEVEGAPRTGDEVHIQLGADITLKENIWFYSNINVVVDGMGKYAIDQNGSYRFYGYNTSITNANLTLKDMKVTGNTELGIVHTLGTLHTVTYDNVVYDGPQPFFSEGSNARAKLVIKNGGTYRLERPKLAPGGQEFAENAMVVFDGGETFIYHALEYYNANAVFWMKNGPTDQSYIELKNRAKVTIHSGDYVLYSDVGAVPIIIGDDCSLDITAAGFNREVGVHSISDFTMGENAFFSYKQEGKPYLEAALRRMHIRGNMTIGKNSTFLYDSIAGIYASGTNTFNEPRLVSIYGKEGALFDNIYNVGIWQVNGVNVVNYWPKAADKDAQLPSSDSSANWPTHIWNTYGPTGRDSYGIGGQFSFSGTGRSSTVSGDAIPDALGRNAGTTLVNTLRFDATAGRIVFGNLTPFEVDKIDTKQDCITGRVNSADVTAVYETLDNGEKTVRSDGFPLYFDDAGKPKSGSDLSVVANMDGLRAAVVAEAFGVLEFITVPTAIDYGSHDVPTVTTVYEREVCTPNENGQMAVRVLDSRGSLSAPWELTLSPTDVQVADKKVLPASELVFLSADGREYSLADGVVPVQSYGAAPSEYEEYVLTWKSDQGLLAKVRPGALDEGSYAAVVQWTIANTPIE